MKRRLFFLFCCALTSLLSADSGKQGREEISVTGTGAPSSFVNHVNTIFGNLLLASVDLPASGPHSLPLVRYYNSQLSYCTWLSGTGMTSNYPLWIRGLPLDEEEKYAYMTAEEDGGSVVCCVSKFHEKEMSFSLDPETIHRGLTNASEEMSARTNLKNICYKMKAHWKDSDTRGQYLKAIWTSQLSNGGEREYYSSENFEDAMNIKGEMKPDGTKLSFEYRSDQKMAGYLKEITACNHSHQHTFGWLKVDYKLDHEKVCVSSNTGSDVTYVFDVHYDKKLGKVPFIEEVHATDSPTIKYSYDMFHGRQYVSKISRPDGRYLKIDYDEKGRVIKQKAPVGRDGEEKTIFTFAYHPKEHKTDVFNAKDRKTVYHYSSRDRLTAVDSYNCKNKLYRGEGLLWGKKETTYKGERDASDEGHLLARTIYDDDRKALLCDRYEYDSHGNVIEEVLYGNLTGGGTNRFYVSDDGHPEKHHVDRYGKQYSYSNDRFHLKKCQREDDGPKTEYEYLDGTDLLTAKLTYDGHHLKRREFFEYDSDAILVKKIVDNGSSTHSSHLSDVTERRITYIKPVRDRCDHGVGQPSRITECYLHVPTGKEHQLKRIEYSYTKAGLVEKEEVYDSHDHHRYTLTTKYDSKNRPIRKTDAMGCEYLFEYDNNFNKTREELVGSGVYTTFCYDKANRLILKADHHDDGLTLSTSYTYDSLGNMRSMTDSFGQTTTYDHDDFNRVCTVVFPDVVDRNGNVISPTEKRDYDLFDNVSSQTDPNGNTVTSVYTVRHQPARISYPDGSSEKYEYNLNGTVARKWERNGSRKEFAYDFLGRVLSTTVYAIDGALLTSSSNTYDAFHCTSSTDPMGHATLFLYDSAGRLLRVQQGDHITEYGYDSLGRKLRTFESWDAGKHIETIEERDFLDRVVEIRKVSSDETLLSHQRFSYDIRGNCTDVTSFTTNDTSTTVHTDFSSRNVPLRVIDALGNVTEVSHDYGWKNGLGQRVLRKVTRDPLGNMTIEVFDALSRLETVERRAADDTLLAKTVFRYDAKGNKTQEKESVVINGVSTRDYVVEWSYTTMNQICCVVEQPGTSDEKATRYTYTKGGLVETITKPDGVILTNTYDGLSRLIELQSSDGTVDYAYTYDLNNNPIAVLDKVLNVTFHRSFDEFGHLVSEDFWPGINVGYSCDWLGRCTRYSVNGTPCVEYEYLSGHLTDVIRKMPSGAELYRHRYTDINLEEKVVESALIHDLGTATMSWDAMGRVSAIATPYWQETIPQDGYDKAGNLLQTTIHDNVGDAGYRYSYDNLYQLTHEEGVFSDDHSFDSICNRLKKNGASYQMNSLNQLLSESSSVYSYDKNGNLIGMTNGDVHLIFSYDALDHLVAVEQPSIFRLEFSYDASHRRLLKRKFVWGDSSWQLSEESRYVYFGNREVGSVDEQGAFKEFRVLGRGKGAELGASIGIELDGIVFCPIHDHRGNITALVDTATRQVHETYRYSAFGEERLFDENNTRQESVSNPWRFSSKRTDPETGFIFFGRRYYSSLIGRFLTPDPVRFSDGPNLYAYVHNSPIMLIDPYGLTTMEDIGETSLEAGMGMGRGFVHPFDTLYANSSRLVEIGHEIYHGDFSRISNASAHDIVTFSSARAGEVIGMAAAGCCLAKSIPGGVVEGTRYITNVFSRVCAKNVCTRAAETQMVVAAEARVAAASEAAVASEALSGAPKRIGASSKPIWSKRVDRTPVQNAFKHWKDHGEEFGEIQNSKQYVENAWKFRDRTDVMVKVRPNAERVLYDPRSNTFGVFTERGVPKTMFKPKDSMDYFKAQ